jgi:uncharacterized protein YprB with RNaseH-like and TPR domain
MRDLASRLRKIVRDNPVSPAPSRELSYVADVGGEQEPEVTASRLGGTLRQGRSGACVVIDRVWAADHRHGTLQVAALRPDARMPLELFDRRLTASNWADRVVFFDIETTGLSGGAGTLAFLAGCGWFEGEAFRVRQFLLAGPAGEPTLLAALAEVFSDTSLLVTYNGRTFDVPTMETRWAFHRSASPTDDLPHFDMLPPARRLWGRRGGMAPPGRRAGSHVRESGLGESPNSCSLTSLERRVLGFHRQGDVPGFEIPTRYFHFLRSGDPTALVDVIEHNQLDLLSLAAVMADGLRLANGGPDACRDASEQLALGRLYERSADTGRAVHAYSAAASSGSREVGSVALARQAELLRREGRHDEACEAWQGVLRLATPERGLNMLERRAAEALAIHLEHRAKDPLEARRYAELLRSGSAGRRRADAEHRLGRLDRKSKKAGNSEGGHEAAPLLSDASQHEG